MKNKKSVWQTRKGTDRHGTRTHTHIYCAIKREREDEETGSKSNGEQRRIYKGKRRKRRRWFAKLRASRNSLREPVKHLNHTSTSPLGDTLAARDRASIV